MKDTEIDIQMVRDVAEKISTSVGGVFRGKNEVIERLLVALFAKGHVLLEDVPAKQYSQKLSRRALILRFRAFNARPISCRPT